MGLDLVELVLELGDGQEAVGGGVADIHAVELVAVHHNDVGVRRVEEGLDAVHAGLWDARVREDARVLKHTQRLLLKRVRWERLLHQTLVELQRTKDQRGSARGLVCFLVRGRRGHHISRVGVDHN